MAKEILFEIMDLGAWSQNLITFNNFHDDYYIEHDFRGNNYIRLINHVDCVANYHYVFDLMGMIEKRFFFKELKPKTNVRLRDQRRFEMENNIKENLFRNHYNMTHVWDRIWNKLNSNEYKHIRKLSLSDVNQTKRSGYLPRAFPFGFPILYPTGYFEVGIQIEYPYRNSPLVDEKEFIFDVLKNDVSIRLTETIGGFLQGFDYRTIYEENITNITKDIVSILYHANDYILKQLQLTDAPEENLSALPSTGYTLPRLDVL